MSDTVLELCLEAGENLMALGRELAAKVPYGNPRREEVTRWVCDMSGGMTEMVRALSVGANAFQTRYPDLEPGSLADVGAMPVCTSGSHGESVCGKRASL